MTVMRIVDVETTGMEPPAEVLEVGFCDFDFDTKTVGSGDSYLCGVDAIPPDSRAVHHIRLEQVAGLPKFDVDAMVKYALDVEAVAIVCHVADFEQKWIGRAFAGVLPIVCTYKAALRMWPAAPSHSVFGLLYWLEDMGKVEYQPNKAYPSHRALPDAYATAIILGALYAAGMTGKDLVRWTSEPRLLPTCPIGKHRGKPWAEVETGFLQWMMKQADMEADLKWNADRELTARGL